MKATIVVALIYITISMLLVTFDFLGRGLQLSLALFTGLAFFTALLSCVKLLIRQEKKMEKVAEANLDEAAATIEKKPFNITIGLGEKFGYVLVAFIFGGWFFASFLPQANGMEAYKIMEWRTYMPIFAIVTCVVLFFYFRIVNKTRTQE
ncbi:hypothetical protein [Shouchella miscanthi]|uniref:DUF3278 domain-containing protein n=1 Tax=Shouchella miscanthi TaxID=2598861 RepID=A0ABU6NJK0_9BACI|nr:hypothetical protein [Shouchella miscanthi]